MPAKVPGENPGLDDIPTGRYVRAMDALPTRERILEAAFFEFYTRTFQAGSLNSIVSAAGVTKGALFHHFEGKQALGYAVVDEVIGPLLMERWLDPVVAAEDPIAAMQASFRRYVRTDIDSGHWKFGCPMNNLAQEMSPVDEGFRSRLDALYTRWRDSYAAALEGRVTADPQEIAALVVAGQMGIWGTGKYSQDEMLMERAGEAVCHYLESVRRS